MKHIILRYRQWRHRRLLRRLFWLYVGKANNPDEAISKAEYAFEYLTRKRSELLAPFY